MENVIPAFICPGRREAIPQRNPADTRNLRIGQGIGSVLLREIEIVAKSFGYNNISLSVDPNNPARCLYEKLGYAQVGWCQTSWTMMKSLS
ncbi:MAG: GNAT family N-acetyltransferase [Sporolactobacillus sp.]